MKKLIFAVAIPLVLLSCNQKADNPNSITTPTDSTQLSKESILKIDSLKLEDSTQVSNNLKAHFRQNVLIFNGLQKPVLDSVYKNELYTGRPLADYSNQSVQQALEKNMTDFFADNKKSSAEYTPESPQTWDRLSDMTVFSNQAGYLTIKYEGSGYSGGAHGYANELYKVVDYENQKVVALTDIIDTKKVSWNKILLKALAKRSEELFEKKKLTYNANFYFYKEKLTFVYGQYEIAPYASGIIEIPVPFSEISNALKSDFKKRMKIK